MKKYDLIIFDCDGTLVNSEPLTNGLIADMINERGIPMTKTRSLEMFAGKTIMHITSFIKQHHPAHDDAAFEQEYRSRCYTIFKESLQPIDGVHDLLNNLDIPICVASNGPKEKMAVTLPASGLDNYFDSSNIFSAYDVQSWKPQPELFHHAAKSMGINPERSLVIEDTWSGVMGAVNGNIDVWAYNPHLDTRLHVHGVPNFLDMTTLQQSLLRYI